MAAVSFHEPCLGETLSQFLDAHERAFEYFGGHTREHLYDRRRTTVCQPGEAHQPDQRDALYDDGEHIAPTAVLNPPMRCCVPVAALPSLHFPGEQG